MRPGFDFDKPHDLGHSLQFWHHGPVHGLLAGDWAGPFVLVAVALLYFVPALVAWRRGHHNRVAIALLNLLLGWTFFGWAVALVWAATAVKSPP